MNPIKILTCYHALPYVQSVKTQVLNSILSSLKQKINVQMIWIIYLPDKLNISLEKNDDVKIIDIHDYSNAVEIMRKEKPDLIYAEPDWGFIDHSFSLAGKFLNIPVLGGLFSWEALMRDQTTVIKSNVTRFFESSVPTDEESNKKQFMRRGRFFIYKLRFLMKTMQSVKLGKFEVIKRLLIILKLAMSPTKKDTTLDPRFANTVHWAEGELSVERLVRAGFDKSSIIVTGNPMYDEVFQRIKNLKLHVKNDDKIHVLLLFTTLYEHGFWTKQQRDLVITEIVREICKHKDKISLTVKIHPSTNILSECKLLINSIDPSIPIHQTGDVVDFIRVSDVVIGLPEGSTSQIYAVLCRKPMIIYNPFGYQNDPFLKRDLALECKTADSLAISIPKILSENPATDLRVDNFIKDFLYKSDGKSSERISDLILSLVKKTTI